MCSTYFGRGIYNLNLGFTSREILIIGHCAAHPLTRPSTRDDGDKCTDKETLVSSILNPCPLISLVDLNYSLLLLFFTFLFLTLVAFPRDFFRVLLLPFSFRLFGPIWLRVILRKVECSGVWFDWGGLFEGWRRSMTAEI